MHGVFSNVNDWLRMMRRWCGINRGIFISWMRGFDRVIFIIWVVSHESFIKKVRCIFDERGNRRLNLNYQQFATKQFLC